MVFFKPLMNHYTPPFLLFNRHLETIYPSLIRRVNGLSYQRERLSTPDDDFLDLDWLKQTSKKLIILSHGLEGNSQRTYMRGMAKVFYQNGYDVLAWNYRGCSEEMNRKIRFYHSGATDDLDLIVNHSISMGYSDINLIGFSLGGNLTLKYMGEKSSELSPLIKKAIVFSVPLNLHTSCIEISKPANWMYNKRFLKSLKKKVNEKAKVISEISIAGLSDISSLIEFDDQYTAPFHGFKNAIDYYEQCSSIRFIESIQRSTLIVNALNDPFLSKDCYPYHLQDHPYLKFEFPQRGGHVGFALFNQNGLYWSELRALQFIQSS
jgi:predicted alpha/beta-fold hydrolase